MSVDVQGLLLLVACLCAAKVAQTLPNCGGIVCSGRTVRTIEELEKLAKDNCTVIDGPLRVISADFCSSAPPRLESIEEVTHFVEIVQLPPAYKSLADLLPNLTLIRGLTTGYNSSALTLAFNPYLKELGLNRLRKICKGDVELHHNYQLGRADKVEWKWIVGENTTVTIYENMAISNLSCNEKCSNCWGPNVSDCQTETSENDCGGCCIIMKNTAPQACNHCGGMNKVYSEDLFRCVEECKDVSVVSQGEWRVKTQPTYKFNETCVSLCPNGYYGNRTTHVCEDEPGQIDCPDVKVISREDDAIHFKNCTHVKGSLVLSAYAGDERTLETYLQQINEVSDYVMVFQTHHMTSLNFLKNLKLIKGRRLWKNKYSLVLYDNVDLSHLNFSDVKIDDGSAYVYSNPRLCATNFSTVMDAYMYNGSSKVKGFGNSLKGLCNTISLNLSFSNETTSGFTVHWSISENRSYEIFGYLVKYRKKWKGRSVMNEDGTDAWSIIHVDSESRSASIGSLDSGTLYEVQVESSRIALEDDVDRQRGEISDVKSVNTTSVLWPLKWKYEKHLCLSSPAATLEFDDDYKDDAKESNKKHFFVHLYDEINWLDARWFPETEDNSTDDGMNCHGWKWPAYCYSYREDLENDKYSKYYSEFQMATASCGCLNQSGIFNLSDSPATKSAKTGSWVKVSEDKNIDHVFEVKELKPFTVYFFLVKTMVDGRCSSWTDAVVFWTQPHCEYDKSYAVSEINPRVMKRSNSTATVTATWRKPKKFDRVLGYTVEFTLKKYAMSDNQISFNKAPCGNQSNDMHKIIDSSRDKTNITTTLPLFATTRLIVIVFTNTSFKYKPCYRRCYRCWPQNSTIVELNGKEPSEEGFDEWPALGGSLGAVALVVLIVCVIFAIKTRKWRKDKAMFDSLRGYLGELDIDLSSLPCSPGGAYEEDEWEVDRVDVTFGDQLGEGAFGLVHSGTLIKEGTSLQVAIKSVLETCDGIQKLHFLREASFMKKFVCDYVVCLLGIVSRGNPPLVIMELMSNGDLKNYLRSKRPGNETSNEISFFSDHFPFAHEEVFQLAAQIATGMAYLSSKNFVHRDLAARNCMVTKDGTVKIGDFGMTRDVYQNDYYRKRGSGPMPVRWMAPESLLDGVFTSASDVWSYGVVLWEISTLSALPYPGLTNEDVILHVSKGKVLEVKELKHIPDLLVSVMRKCWRYQILDRPSYTDILKELPALEGYEAVV